MVKRLLFSVTLADCRIDTFRSGGKGGGNQNARSTGVRITHLASGSTGEARDSRHQAQNKKAAFCRMAGSAKMMKWLRAEAARKMGKQEKERIETEELAKKVDKMMDLENLKIEVSGNGGWQEEKRTIYLDPSENYDPVWE